MAGDTGVLEQAFVIGPGGTDAPSVVAALRDLGARVIHHYGERVVIAEVLRETAAAIAAQFREVSVESDAERYERMGGPVDDTGAMGLRAFYLRQSDEYLRAKAQRPLDGANWDAPGAAAPDLPAGAAFAAEAPEATAAPTSSQLTGSVAVGIVIVEGAGELAFSIQERVKVVAEVQNGLTWLGVQASPATVSWIHDLRVVQLTVAPDPADDDGAKKEARWRDPALAALGFRAGLGGVRDFVEELRNLHDTDWAYCGFFTKYPVGHFAYANIGGPRAVMHFENDGWGRDNIDRVFAHETGHIFGAPDEYASSGCTCGGQFGICKKPNGNCANCATGGGVPCIMRANTFQMCGLTPFHLGYGVVATVPSVGGLLQGHALQTLREVCLAPKLTGSTGPEAVVWKQTPIAGTKRPRGSTVTLLMKIDPIP